MHSLADAILPVLPRLRRYAAAVTGSRCAGDQYIEICLETLIQEPGRITLAANIARQLFDLFHDAVDACGIEIEPPADPDLESLQRAVLGLKLRDRRLVLLRLLEGFSLAETAVMLDMPEAETESRLKKICAEFKDLCSARVLVIENEKRVPADLADIIAHTGHRLVGVAADSHGAATLAQRRHPNLVVADLHGSGAGLGAVRQLIEAEHLPVIFLGRRPAVRLKDDAADAIFVVENPHDHRLLEETIGRALLTSVPNEVALDRVAGD